MLKNITLSADEKLIQLAREKAKKEKTSLNQQFRQWLIKYLSTGQSRDNYQDLMKTLMYVNPGKTFSREELNER
ncbi:MAG: hypothetical protein KDD63_28210 [Bacteroidetes bacterium]|nr:hypothetical protein [Bacteroidota bacterium]MCB0856149.1 hypothetical protein [Bacteroidota bacterium]